MAILVCSSCAPQLAHLREAQTTIEFPGQGQFVMSRIGCDITRSEYRNTTSTPLKVEYIALVAVDDRGHQSDGGMVTFNTVVPPHGKSFGKSHSSFQYVKCHRIAKILGSFH
jgi:hypothetical protein